MHTLFDRIEAFIAYQPLLGEPDPAAFVDVPPAYRIAPRAELDPQEELARALEAVGSKRTAVLLPGTRFDAAGTRHGRGGGWYDRFLATAPQEWLRVGFCFSEELSPSPLPREAWDEPVDLVCVVDRETGTCAWHETGARS